MTSSDNDNTARRSAMTLALSTNHYFSKEYIFKKCFDDMARLLTGHLAIEDFVRMLSWQFNGKTHVRLSFLDLEKGMVCIDLQFPERDKWALVGAYEIAGALVPDFPHPLNVGRNMNVALHQESYNLIDHSQMKAMLVSLRLHKPDPEIWDDWEYDHYIKEQIKRAPSLRKMVTRRHHPNPEEN
jgi:hypothetical protein